MFAAKLRLNYVSRPSFFVIWQRNFCNRITSMPGTMIFRHCGTVFQHSVRKMNVMLKY